jgi:hypothetical protein
MPASFVDRYGSFSLYDLTTTELMPAVYRQREGEREMKPACCLLLGRKPGTITPIQGVAVC